MCVEDGVLRDFPPRASELSTVRVRFRTSTTKVQKRTKRGFPVIFVILASELAGLVGWRDFAFSTLPLVFC